MPRSTQAFPAKLGMNHNPLRTLLFDPTGTLLGAQEVLTLPNLAEAFIKQAILDLLQQIDQFTGLDLVALAQALNALFGGGQNLLVAFVNSFQTLESFIVNVLAGLSLPTGLTDATAFIAFLQNAGANILQTLINDVVGSVENTLPWVFPFTFGLQTTVTDLANFLNTLVTGRQLQDLQDLIYNTLSGVPQNQWVTGVSKANIVAALQQLQANTSAAQNLAQTAIGNIANLTTITAQNLNTLINIPSANVQAGLGQAALTAGGLGGQVQQFIDAGVQGFNNVLTTGNPIAQFAAAASGIANQLGWNPFGSPPPNSTTAIANTLRDFNRFLPTTGPMWEGVDPSGDSTFPAHAFQGGSLTTVNVTQTASLIGYIATPHGGLKQSVSWLGGHTTNITSIVLNIYQLNISGQSQFLCSSGNLIGFVSDNPTPQWCYWNIPAAQYVNAAQGNVYLVEMQIQGSGTYTIAGITSPLSGLQHNSMPGVMASSRTLLTPPVFDSAGGWGQTTGPNTPDPITWTHPALGANANYVTVLISWQTTSGSPTASFGGQAMTAVPGTFQFYNDGTNSINCNVFELFFAPGTFTGSQTVSFTATGGTNFMGATSLAYSGVSSRGTMTSAGVLQAQTTTMQMSTAGTPGQTLLGAFFNAASGTPPFTPMYPANYNIRTNNPNTGNSGGIIAADASNLANYIFTAAMPVAGYWGGVMIPLNGVVGPAPPYLPQQTPTTSVPFFIMSGGPGVGQFTPDLLTFLQTGTFDPTRFKWANSFDIITCGGGGGGRGGGNLQGGVGGLAAQWAATTISAAQAGSQIWTVTVDQGGPGGAPGNYGTSGGSSYVTIPGLGVVAQSVGGIGGFGLTGSASGGPGGSPGNETYNGPTWGGTPTTYFGGSGGPVPQSAGSQPGGGGAGGNVSFSTYIAGGPGGAGIVYILAYT